MKTAGRLSTLAMLALAAPFAAAETCKYVDGDGNVTYSNIAVKNAKKASCFPERTSPPQPNNPAKAAAPADVPSVDAKKQSPPSETE
jgi:hypothetical protein